jgi:hypothetical protein
MLLGGVRGKKKKAGGSTRNKVNPYLEFSNYFILILYLTFVVIRPVPAQNYSLIEWKWHCSLCCGQIEHEHWTTTEWALARQSLNIKRFASFSKWSIIFISFHFHSFISFEIDFSADFLQDGSAAWRSTMARGFQSARFSLTRDYRGFCRVGM